VGYFRFVEVVSWLNATPPTNQHFATQRATGWPRFGASKKARAARPVLTA